MRIETVEVGGRKFARLIGDHGQVIAAAGELAGPKSLMPERSAEARLQQLLCDSLRSHHDALGCQRLPNGAYLAND